MTQQLCVPVKAFRPPNRQQPHHLSQNNSAINPYNHRSSSSPGSISSHLYNLSENLALEKDRILLALKSDHYNNNNNNYNNNNNTFNGSFTLSSPAPYHSTDGSSTPPLPSDYDSVRTASLPSSSSFDPSNPSTDQTPSSNQSKSLSIISSHSRKSSNQSTNSSGSLASRAALAMKFESTNQSNDSKPTSPTPDQHSTFATAAQYNTQSDASKWYQLIDVDDISLSLSHKQSRDELLLIRQLALSKMAHMSKRASNIQNLN